MSILDLISNETGFHFKKKTAKEYGGPCPFCADHGRDRFSILPDEDHWVCRRCRQAGDAIGFIIKYKSLTYKKALAYALSVGVQINAPYTPLDKYDSSKPSIPKWEPREDTKPAAAWQEKAKAQLFQAYKFLLSSNWEAKVHRKWLNDRGISNDLIKSGRLGWNLNTATFSRSSWGLAPELTQKGKNKQIWLPSGLIIPYFQDGELIRLRIRQDNPTRGDRFIMVPGSSMNFMEYETVCQGGQGDTGNQDVDMGPCPSEKIPVMMVEAELDGMLIHDQAQKAGVFLKVYAIGNSSTRPNQAAHDIISKAPQVLMCLDNDEAGDTETIWHRHQYIRAKDCRIPKEYGKDPGEAYEHRFDFSEWFKQILTPHAPKSRPPEIQPTVAKNTTVEQVAQSHAPADTEVDAAPTTTMSFDDALNLVEDLPDPEDPAEIIRMGHFCIHGHYCGSAKDNICLRTKQNIFTMEKCPVDYWYRTSNGHVDMVILGCGFKQKRG